MFGPSQNPLPHLGTLVLTMHVSRHSLLCICFYTSHSMHLLQCIYFCSSHSMHLLLRISLCSLKIYWTLDNEFRESSSLQRPLSLEVPHGSQKIMDWPAERTRGFQTPWSSSREGGSTLQSERLMPPLCKFYVLCKHSLVFKGQGEINCLTFLIPSVLLAECLRCLEAKPT